MSEKVHATIPKGIVGGFEFRNSLLIISHITFRDGRVHIFFDTFLEIAVCYTLLRFVQHPVGIVLGKTFYVVSLCHSCSPVLVVNLSIYNNFNNKDLVRSGLIEIFLFSNCCTYILEGGLSDSIKTSCVLSFCRRKSN